MVFRSIPEGIVVSLVEALFLCSSLQLETAIDWENLWNVISSYDVLLSSHFIEIVKICFYVIDSRSATLLSSLRDLNMIYGARIVEVFVCAGLLRNTMSAFRTLCKAKQNNTHIGA